MKQSLLVHLSFALALLISVLRPGPAQAAGWVELDGVLSEVSFLLPDGFTLNEDADRKSPGTVIYENIGGGRATMLGVAAVEVPRLFRGLPQNELASLVWDTEEKGLRGGADRIEYVRRSERVVGGYRYPLMESRFTAAGALSDFAEVLYFPGDFDVRHRAYGIYWVDARPNGRPASGLATFDSVVSSFWVRPVGEVIKSDDFDDPASGLLPRQGSAVGFSWRYADGEYVLQKESDEPGGYSLWPNGDLGNASVEIDANLAAGNGNIILYCRRTSDPNGPSGYAFVVAPAVGQFHIARYDDGQLVQLLGWRGNPNLTSESSRLALSCAGSIVSARINGVLVGMVEDDTYEQGSTGIGISGGEGQKLEVRFSALEIIQR